MRWRWRLAVGAYDNPALAPVDITPVETVQPEDAYIPNQWTPPTDAPDMPEPANLSESYQLPPLDPGRERWANELPLTPQERADRSLVRETQAANISSYPGSGAEQGGHGQRPQVAGKPTAAQLCSRLSRRGRDLL